jgi:predicted metal-dependent phosphoesterase TrpH
MNKKTGIKKIENWRHLGKADLHIHSVFSDGSSTISQILDYAENFTDLGCIAITDHNTINGALEARKLQLQKYYRFELIVGEEVSSKEGHILALFIEKPIPEGLSARETLKLIHAQGGVAIASHPFEHTRFNNPNMVMMDGVGAATMIKERKYFDGIEVVNATPTLSDENLRASALNRTLLGLTETGSSDAHIPDAIGRGYTLFEGETAKELKIALLSRQTQGMYSKWTLMALLRYLFFFVPRGLRLLINTIIHGKRPRRNDLF